MIECQISEKQPGNDYALLQQVFNLSPGLMLLIDAGAKKIVNTNEAASTSLGYAKDALLQVGLPDIDTAFAAKVDEIINLTGNSTTFFTNFKRKDKSNLEVKVTLKYFQHSEQEYVIVSATDQTAIHNCDQVGAFHSTLLDNISDAIVSTDGNLIITAWNKHAEEIFGWTAEEVIGKPTREVTAASYPDTTSEEVAALLFKNGFWRGEITANTKKGGKLPCHISIGTLKDARGSISGTVAVVRDISEIKRKEEQVAYLADLVDKVNDAIISLDSSYNIVSWNKGAETIYETEQKEVIGKSLFPLTITNLLPLKDQVLGVLQKEEMWQGEILLTTQKQAQKWILTTFSKIIKKDIITGYVVVGKDITDRKRLELQLRELNSALEKRVAEKTEELRNVFERITDGFVAFDKDWNYLIINEQAGKLLGTTANQVIGKNIWKELPELVGSTTYKNYQRALNEQQVIEVEEYYERFGKWIQSSVYPSPQGVSVYFHDTTEKRKHLTDLETSELKYRTLVENAQEGIWQIDAGGRTSFVNNYLSSMLGYKKEEMIGRTLFDFMVEEAKPYALELLEKRRSGYSEQHDFILQKKDLTSVHARLQTAPIMRNGQYDGALAMVLDITERKKTEEKLVASEKRFKALFEHSLDGIALLTKEGKIFDVSPSIKNILGLTKEELIGTSRLDYIAPEHIHIVIDTVVEIAGKPFEAKTAEYEAIMPDRSRKWLQCTYSNLLDEPAVNAIVLNFRDITERKIAENKIRESEARYRKAQEQGRLGHWELNLKSFELVWSDEVYALFNLMPAQFHPNLDSFFEHIHQDDKERLRSEVQQTLTEGKAINSTYRVVCKEGTVKYLHSVGEIIKDNSGLPIKIAGMVQDVTKQKLVEEELKLSEKNYRLLFEENPVPLWMIDVDSLNFLQVNQAFITMYGYTRQELEKMNVREIRQLDEEPFLHFLQVEGKEGKTVEGIVRHKKKDGEIIHVKITANPIYYNGRYVWLGAGRNITKELLYEKHLKQSQQQLSLIFNNTVNSMMLVSLEGKRELRIEAVNDALVTRMGIQKEDLEGKLVSQVVDVESFKPLIDGYQRAIETGEIQKFSAAVQIGDEKRISELTVVPVKNENQQVVQLLTNSNDITDRTIAEQKLIQSEEKYRLLFDKSPLPMWIFDKETLKTLEVNNAAVEHYGFTMEEFLTMTLVDLKPEESLAELQEVREKKRIGSYNGLTQHKKKNGEIIQVQVSANFIDYDNRKAVLALLSDRTEQERSRRELITTTERLRELASHIENIREEERTNIAREIHDELGQQLTALKMDVSWISRKITSGDEKVSAKIKSSLDLIDVTINSVRRIAAQLRPSILDDLGLADAIDWQSREFSKRTGIEIEYRPDVNNVKLSPAISIALFRIFQEALTNIARHAKATKIMCDLKTEAGTVSLRIEDNGIGFDLEQRTARKTLGLLGMKERVTILKGEYSIESQPGKGTVLHVKIPLV